MFRRVMPAPGKDTYTLGDVAMMRRYVEEMEGRIFEIQRGRYEILQEMERLERMKTNKEADLRILDKLSEEIDISLTAVKVSLRTYELGGRCRLIRLHAGFDGLCLNSMPLLSSPSVRRHSARLHCLERLSSLRCHARAVRRKKLAASPCIMAPQSHYGLSLCSSALVTCLTLNVCKHACCFRFWVLASSHHLAPDR